LQDPNHLTYPTFHQIHLTVNHIHNARRPAQEGLGERQDGFEEAKIQASFTVKLSRRLEAELPR
jgi:hypothetical protein